MWIVREGYEGLVRGNQEHAEIRKEVNAVAKEELLVEAELRANKVTAKSQTDEYLLHNLRFGDGGLLRDGTSEYVGGRTLKGRYIVRVGWDDVRGWFSEVCCSCH
jgi:6-phosphofructokinase 1